MPDTLPPADFARTGLWVQRSGPVPTGFQVLGERASGTNYIRKLIELNCALRRTEGLGWKHGFPSALAVPPDLAVICAVRAPEPWALSMFAKPWHTVPALQSLGFSDFIRAPWETTVDRARYFGGAQALVGQPLLPDRDPVTGAAMRNLFALRRAKLRALLSYTVRAQTFVLVRTETLQADPEGTLDALAGGLGLPARSAPFRGVTRRLGSKFKPAVAARPDAPAAMTPADLAFMRAELDPELESRLGYSI